MISPILINYWNALTKKKKIIPPKKNIQMLKDKYFEIIVPIYTHYWKQNYVNAGLWHNKPTLDNGEKVEIDLQLYFYHSCDHKFFNKFNKENLDDNNSKKTNEIENNENKKVE
jgi:hypothetical protein